MADACIKVPADWTAEADIERYVALYGESSDYFGDQLDRVFEGVEQLEKVVDRVLTYFGIKGKDDRTPTIKENLSALYLHVQNNSHSPRHREILIESLSMCSEAISEYGRIVSDYKDKPEHVWLTQLIDLSGLVVTASLQLEGAMVCAYPDFEDRSSSPQ
jgi:hypothetical protein